MSSSRPSFAERPSNRGTSRAADVGRRSGEVGSNRTSVGRPDYDRGLERATDRVGRTTDRANDGLNRATDRASRTADRATDRGIDGRARGGADARFGNDNARVRNDANVRAGRDGADGRSSTRVGRSNAPSRGDVANQLGLKDRNGRNDGRNSRLVDRPNWTNNVRNTNVQKVQNTLARATGANRDFNVSDVRNAQRNNYLSNNPNRARQWQRWANPYRNNWSGNRYSYFNNRWWATHSIGWPYRYLNYLGFGFGGGYGGYGYGGYGYRPWGYWWGQPSWIGINRWFGPSWGYGGYAWGTPCYYDYGPGGNVVYYDDGVYVNDTFVATPEDYAASAATLATIEPDMIREERGEWMALGTFALILDRDSDDMERLVQLAVDKDGIISGTYFNRDTDKAFAITGRVDKDTQRVAFRSDSNPDLVFETGIYNLTQDETPVLLHDGPGEPETVMLVRLDPPEGAEDVEPAPSDR